MVGKMAQYQVSEPKIARIRSILGNPDWEDCGVLIYQGNCLELMEKLPNDLVDLTVTSPPYNIGKEYEQLRPLEEYISWCAQWCGELYRLTAPDGAFWLNLGYLNVPGRGRAVPIPYLLWEHMPFFLLQEIIWNYGAGVSAKTMFSPRNEKWLWYVKDQEKYAFNLDDVRDPNVKYPNQKKNGRIRVNPLGKNPTDVWQIPKVTTGAGRVGQRASPERTSHPAQFPEAVVDRIVRACSTEDDLIMDPFSGSGTTGVVSTRLGRPCVLFEISPQYVEMAAKRIEVAIRRSSVFQPALLERPRDFED